MTDALSSDFLHSMDEIERVLSLMNFEMHSSNDRGSAHYVEFKRNDTTVEFMFGPPEFQVEIIVHIASKEYAFKDLLQGPDIADWVRNNKYRQDGKRAVKNELMWFVELLKFSLGVLNR
jgi:hypothetical protein